MELRDRWIHKYMGLVTISCAVCSHCLAPDHSWYRHVGRNLLVPAWAPSPPAHWLYPASQAVCILGHLLETELLSGALGLLRSPGRLQSSSGRAIPAGLQSPSAAGSWTEPWVQAGIVPCFHMLSDLVQAEILNIQNVRPIFRKLTDVQMLAASFISLVSFLTMH